MVLCISPDQYEFPESYLEQLPSPCELFQFFYQCFHMPHITATPTVEGEYNLSKTCGHQSNSPNFLSSSPYETSENEKPQNCNCTHFPISFSSHRRWAVHHFAFQGWVSNQWFWSLYFHFFYNLDSNPKYFQLLFRK